MAYQVARNMNGAAGELIAGLLLIKAWTYEDVAPWVAKLKWGPGRPKQMDLDRLEFWLAAPQWPKDQLEYFKSQGWLDPERELGAILEIQSGPITRTPKQIVRALQTGSHIGTVRRMALSILQTKNWQIHEELLWELLSREAEYEVATKGGFGVATLLGVWVAQAEVGVGVRSTG